MGPAGVIFGGSLHPARRTSLSLPLRSQASLRRGSRWNDLIGLLCLLSLSLTIALAFGRPADYFHGSEYMGSAMKMAKTGHIQDDFLPVLYPALLAQGFRITESRTGVTTANIALSLLMLASAWLFLRLSGLSLPLTLFVVFGLSLYPDFFFSYAKVQDTSLTAISIFSFLSATIYMCRETDRLWLPDLLVGITLGVAILVRSEMVTLGAVSLFVMHRLKMRRLVQRFLTQAVAAAVIYCSVAALIHGSVFFPRNGSYNLFAGYNPYTSSHLWNEEDSIGQACSADHVACNPSRDPRFDPFYRAAAIAFMRQHPGQVVELFLLKFGYMMLPDLHLHPLDTLAGMAKVFAALGIPLWIFVSIFCHRRGSFDTRLLIASVLFALLLPFCLIISTHRYRVPLDYLCWTDLGATALLALDERSKDKRQRTGRAGDP